MATTSAGNPYVESSDLVANYPATSLALANRLDKYAVNPFADAAARDAAIPTPVQGQLAQTLDDNKVWRYDGTAWAPFSGAVSAANFTDTASGNYTDASGQAWKFLTFSGTSSVTIDQAGFCDLLVVGAGGAGGSGGPGGGGGGGGLLYVENAFLSAATHVVTVGAGGSAAPVQANYGFHPGNNGNASRIADYYSPGGAGGAVPSLAIPANSVTGTDGLNGGSGGGASGQDGSLPALAGGSGVVGIGSDGGGTNASVGAAAGGGGGAGSGVLGRGGDAGTSQIGGNGGEGAVTTIRNTTIYISGGGGGGGTTTPGTGGSGIGGPGSTGTTGGAGSPGTGSGGGGSSSPSSGNGGNGGSGTVTIRVKV